MSTDMIYSDNCLTITIRKVLHRLFLFLCFLVIPFSLSASDELSGQEGFDATEMIMHHIGDSYEYSIVSFTNGRGEKVKVSLPLPVIIWHEGHLKIFSSADFKGGEELVPIGDAYLKLYHEKVYLTDASGEIRYNENKEVINATPLNFSITKNVASMILSCGLILLIFIPAARRYSRKGAYVAPGGTQTIVEPLVQFLMDDIVKAQIDEKKAEKFSPYLLTIFVFILMNNLLGLVPFFPGGANLSGNIAFTLTLAVFTFLAVNLFGSKHYWKDIFTVPGTPFLIKILLVPIEIVGMFTKPFALMLRLFANITAGHIIVLSLVSIIFVMKTVFVSPVSVGLSVFIYSLELLVAFLQAYIFTLLSALYIGLAVNEHH